MFPLIFSCETPHNVCNQSQKCRGRSDPIVKLLPPHMNSNPLTDGTVVVDLDYTKFNQSNIFELWLDYCFQWL